MRFLLSIALLLSLVACKEKSDFEKEQDRYVEVMSWLNDADPRKDFERAIENNDFRFMGIYGYSLQVPTVKASCLDYDRDINPIEGTSDAIMGYKHAKMIAIARTYAEDYNSRMRYYLEQNTDFKCDY